MQERAPSPVGPEPVVPAGIAVVGTGLAGLAAALALAARGVACDLFGSAVDAAAIARDTRSTALFGPSLTLLSRIGALDALAGKAVPLVGLRLIDDTGGVLRAPEVMFAASEIGEAAFGMNVENGPLLAALARCARASPLIQWHETAVTAVAVGDDVVEVGFGEGLSGDGGTVRSGAGNALRVRLLVGADGARSLCRSAAGIAVRDWQYPQVAIATRFAHQRPHHGVSTELHRRPGPMTTVPLYGNRSALVWVETPAEAGRLAALDDVAFAGALEQRLGSILGAISDVGPRASFPITGVTAEPLGANRVALVGEAGHRLPPIGAQGLNLGLRDAAWLADLVADAVAAGGDPGAPDVLAAYDRARRGDVASRTAVVDALNRSLLADLLPVDLARGAGLAALKAIGPLRRLLMREGMRPGGPLPTLMQPLCETGACGSGLA